MDFLSGFCTCPKMHNKLGEEWLGMNGSFKYLLKCSFKCFCFTEKQEKCHLAIHYLFEMGCINSIDESSFW